MGNRAVITTKENFKNNGVGVYVHWNGGKNSIIAFLAYCDIKEYRRPENDCYGWARLCQVIGNFFGGEASVGIDVVNRLDCDNYDNGVYFIENWQIVDRKYAHYNEPFDKDYIREMVFCINAFMPEREQIDENILQEKLDDYLLKFIKEK